MGFEIESEVLSSRGRMDAVVKTGKHVYIIEFKLAASSDGALKQIKEKGYADAYALDGRPVTLIGLAYDTDKKVLADAAIEVA